MGYIFQRQEDVYGDATRMLPRIHIRGSALGHGNEKSLFSE
jgi:hypothetical protein